MSRLFEPKRGLWVSIGELVGVTPGYLKIVMHDNCIIGDVTSIFRAESQRIGKARAGHYTRRPGQ